MEMEQHFLLECAAYEDLMHHLFCEIAFVNPSFSFFSEQAFVYSMLDQLCVELHSRVGLLSCKFL